MGKWNFYSLYGTRVLWKKKKCLNINIICGSKNGLKWKQSTKYQIEMQETINMTSIWIKVNWRHKMHRIDMLVNEICIKKSLPKYRNYSFGSSQEFHVWKWKYGLRDK